MATAGDLCGTLLFALLYILDCFKLSLQFAFKESDVERIFSRDLVEKLIGMTDRPWPEAWRVKSERTVGTQRIRTGNGFEQSVKLSSTYNSI